MIPAHPERTVDVRQTLAPPSVLPELDVSMTIITNGDNGADVLADEDGEGIGGVVGLKRFTSTDPASVSVPPQDPFSDAGPQRGVEVHPVILVTESSKASVTDGVWVFCCPTLTPVSFPYHVFFCHLL